MSRGCVRIEDGQKRVRVYLGGELVADTIRPKLVWEKPYYPTYYFPEADVRLEALSPTEHTRRSPSRGTADVFDVPSARRTAEQVAYRHSESPIEELQTMVAFDLASMDSWFEEDEEVFVRARDPYTRVDVLPSSHSIEVRADGEAVAESSNARFLFETGLPARYYLPKTDVRMDLLTPSDTPVTAPTRARPSTGRLRSTAPTTRTSPGATAPRCPRAPGSVDSSASTTRKSTSSSMAILWSGPRPSSPDRTGAGQGRDPSVTAELSGATPI